MDVRVSWMDFPRKTCSKWYYYGYSPTEPGQCLFFSAKGLADFTEEFRYRQTKFVIAFYICNLKEEEKNSLNSLAKSFFVQIFWILNVGYIFHTIYNALFSTSFPQK